MFRGLHRGDCFTVKTYSQAHYGGKAAVSSHCSIPICDKKKKKKKPGMVYKEAILPTANHNLEVSHSLCGLCVK